MQRHRVGPSEVDFHLFGIVRRAVRVDLLESIRDVLRLVRQRIVLKPLALRTGRRPVAFHETNLLERRVWAALAFHGKSGIVGLTRRCPG